ncbi:MAG: Bax inhibitor-1/YccA family protein [Alphaproteobacteria bacterium]|nr:Bax inhibitor-1/YccA family protein [Alphaproteobacteria bacterium]
MVDPFFRNPAAMDSSSAVSYDAGLRAHMIRVFNYMGGGLALTGLIAFLVANTFLAGLIFGSKLTAYAAMFAPLAFVMFMGFKLQKASASTAQTMFWVFCGLMGLSMSSIFMVFTGASIARVFFITSATFAGMSLWGYTTKKDLASFGSFLLMGVLGLFIASIVNLFMQSSGLQWIVSIVGVGVFTGLTAYDVQNIKRNYSESWGSEANNKLAVMGALSLYMNFINAFQFLLSLMGDRR